MDKEIFMKAFEEFFKGKSARKIEEEYQILKDNMNKYANDRQLYYYEISKKQDRVIQRAKTKRYSSRR